LTDLDSPEIADTSAAFCVILVFVGALITVISFLGIVSPPEDALIIFAGSYVIVYGALPFFALLFSSRPAVLAYLTDGDSQRIPRWVPMGLLAGILAEAGGLILAFYAISATSSGPTFEESASAAVLCGIGIEPLRYSVAFLKGYWAED